MLTGLIMISAVIEQMYWSGTATSLASDGPAAALLPPSPTPLPPEHTTHTSTAQHDPRRVLKEVSVVAHALGLDLRLVVALDVLAAKVLEAHRSIQRSADAVQIRLERDRAPRHSSPHRWPGGGHHRAASV